MKKLLFLVCLMLLFSLTACQTLSQASPHPESSNNPEEPDISDMLEQEIEETDFRKPKPLRDELDYIPPMSHAMYINFEEIVDKVTHIVVATYIETYDYVGHCEYKFLVKSLIKGNISDRYIYVYCNYWNKITMDDVGTFRDGNSYEKGKDYVLLLSKEVSVYYDHDRYTGWYTFFPTDSPEDFSIFGGHPISEHSSAPADTFSSTKKLIKYLSQLTAADTTNKDFAGTEYTRSDDMETIIGEAEYVLRIIPREEVREDLWGNVLLICDVVEQYKGEVKNVPLYITFLPDTVTLDEEYIVTLVYCGFKSYYNLSAQHGVSDISKEAEVMTYIAPQ